MNTKKFTLTAIFLAVILLLALTPFGFLNLVFIKATIVHVPVILASIILGPRIGGFLGGVFGLSSMIVNTFSPAPLSFAFSPFIPVIGTSHGSLWALVIAFIPRILVGILPYYFYKLFGKLTKKNSLSLFMSSICGSFINTLLVMNLIFFLFQSAYATATGITVGESVYKAVLFIIFTNGIAEAIIAGILTSAVGKPLLKIMEKQQSFSR